MPANEAQSQWHALLLSAVRLQREVEGTVLVGGTAVSLLVHHRYSTDADHVVLDLPERFDRVLQHLEGLDGWRTARIQRPVMILGSLDGMEAGVRQLLRKVPLETQVVRYAGQELCIPTYGELLRVKAFLVLQRGATRDYVDFLSLATLESLYGAILDENRGAGKGLLFVLGNALEEARPRDLAKVQWGHFDAIEADRPPWDATRLWHEGREQGARVRDIWEQLREGEGTLPQGTIGW